MVPLNEHGAHGTHASFGRGKVILLGEHAVVYGRPALAAGLTRGVYAKATHASDDVLFIDPWNDRVVPDPDSEHALARAFSALLSTYESEGVLANDKARERPRIHVRATVGLPGGAGLGCSAALAVAVLAAIDACIGVSRPPEERAVASLAWERVFHGNPSGIDSTMAAIGGVALYRKGVAPERLALRTPLRLVIGNSGESSSTKAMVDAVAHQYARSKARVEDVFDAIEDLVSSGARSLTTDDHVHLGRLMNLNHALLSGLMLSTSRIEDMCTAARDAGALGAKVTGAGGGGCMVALVRDESTAEDVVSAIAKLDREAFACEVQSEEKGVA